jgi:serine/threonine-protein kinase
MQQTVDALTLGKYTLIGEIARGGMGVVYIAQAQGPGGFKKSVIIKELKPELADDDNFREMFLEEANLAARLNHRNIVQTNEVGQDNGRYFMAMDYLEGCSLHVARKRLQGERKLALNVQLRIVSEVLAGLHYAHELTDYDGSPMGVVHRDVGPQNVFLTYDGQVKLIDFGVAKVLNRQLETQAGVLKGRVAYMAPEQVGGGAVDRRVDIFAAGVLLREIVTNQRLWEGLGEIDTLKKLIGRDIPPFPAELDVPAELREICIKAMAPERDDRFRTAHEMRVKLEQFVLRADPTGSLADLGTQLALGFEAERKRMKDLLDGHLAAGGKTSIPAIDLHPPGSSPELSSGSSSGPHSGSGARSGPVSSSNRGARTPASSTLASLEAPEIDVHHEAPMASPPPSKRRGLLVGGSAAVAVVAVAAFALSRTSAHPPSQDRPVASAAVLPTAPAPSAAPAATSTPDRADTVELTVRVTPSNAQIFVDDAPVQGNPFRARFPRNSAATHAVRATAFNYVSKTELVKFDANASLSMSLERQVAGVAPAPAVRADVRAGSGAAPATLIPDAPQPTKPSSSEINPRGGKPPKRDIDPKNPYGVE